jgi:hypothetical protein
MFLVQTRTTLPNVTLGDRNVRSQLFRVRTATKTALDYVWR